MDSKKATLNLEVEFLRCTGENLSEIKHFCHKDVTITYETCEIDDYWCIKLYNCLSEKTEVVPDGDYIVKLPNGGFTIVYSVEFEKYFDFEGKNEYIQNIKEENKKQHEVFVEMFNKMKGYENKEGEKVLTKLPKNI